MPEVQQLREKIQEGQKHEALYLGQVRSLQAENVERADELGNRATAREEAAQRERRASTRRAPRIARIPKDDRRPTG